MEYFHRVDFFCMPEKFTNSLSLSTCWNSHRHEDGLSLLEECATLGFEWVELSHGIRKSLLSGIFEGVKRNIVRISSVHHSLPLPVGFSSAAPNAYEFSDGDAHRHEKAERLTLETIDHAAEVGAKAVVVHMGSTGQSAVTSQLFSLLRKGQFGSRKYVQLKLNAVLEHEKRFCSIWPQVRGHLLKCAEHANKYGIKLGLECREKIEEIPMDSLWPEIFAEMPDNVGYWHDFGHAGLKETLGFVDSLALWQKWKHRLIGCHVHDIVGLNRDHSALGEGRISFESYWEFLNGSSPLFVLELSPHVTKQKVKESLLWWRAHGYSAGSR